MPRDVERDYEANVGRPPRNLPDDHPDVWQWTYRGTREERDMLLDRLDARSEDQPPMEQGVLC